MSLWWQRILFPPLRATLLVLKSHEKVWKSTQRNVALAVSDHGQGDPRPAPGAGVGARQVMREVPPSLSLFVLAK